VAARTPEQRLPAGTKLLERLVQEAMIEPAQMQRAILHAQQIEGRCEDAIIEIGAMTEAELLTYLANVFRTRFVTTPKLAKVSVSPALLNLVPRKLADKLLVFPILYDQESSTLSVVAAAPGEHDIVKQIQMVSRVRNVSVYVARPATILALIRKHYDGDRTAFAELATRFPSIDRSLGVGQQTQAGVDYYQNTAGPAANPMTDPSMGTGEHPLAPAARRRRKSSTRTEAPVLSNVTSDMTQTNIGPARRAAAAPAIRIEAPAQPPAASPPHVPLIQSTPAAPAGVGFSDYLDTLNVMVALLEQSRNELRGHSAQVARLSKRLAEKVGLPEVEAFGLVVAAQIHDIGKGASYHLTPLNVAQYEGHRIQAQKTYLAPLRFFESVKLEKTTTDALTHLYERPDGKGFPDKIGGKDFPMAARILAVVETYCDLSSHAKNPYRKILEPKEAVEALDRYRDKFFDGNVIDILKSVVLGDDIKSKLLSDRPTVLLVDSDAEETAVLELRLVEHGFEVDIARSAIDAYERVQKGGIDAVISEVDLSPIDGFELVARLRQGGKGAEVPVLFVTRRGDRDSVNRGFEIGAADYLVKPASGDVVAAKTRQVLSAGQKARGGGGGRGVSGSLSEMALPDVVQILSNGRKSGQLAIVANNREGRILFNEGMIWDATFGQLRGEDAFYEMLVLSDGEFTLDPSVRPAERVINMSSEGLLLEGMRRLDEAR
jgi:response regulator RpfG family c-di-GMP phosphodiesterase